MRQLARQKLGEAHDIYAVTGKLAIKAKYHQPF
jgi:hypothetical protein